MHGEREFAKTNGSICNILIVAANICNFCQGLQFSNGLIVVKLKQDLQYRCYVYFEPVLQNVIYLTVYYLKTHNKLYEDIFISEGLRSKEMINFSGIDEHQDVANMVYFEDPLSLHRIGSNDTGLVSEILYIINYENVIIAQGQWKK